MLGKDWLFFHKSSQRKQEMWKIAILSVMELELNGAAHGEGVLAQKIYAVIYRQVFEALLAGLPYCS